jgi:UDP-galactopyranose mutase
MIAIVGAGMSGASLARALADRGVRTHLFEMHSSVGGMCRETQWKDRCVPELGPHIFRTSCQQTWEFLARFCELESCQHRVATMVNEIARPFPPLDGPPPVLTGTPYPQLDTT